jgi:Flp pilus assembly protein TadB
VCVTFELIISHPRDAAARRERLVAQHLPLFAELLGERISSGVPFASALTEATNTLPEGILRKELEQLRGDIQRGIPARRALGAFKSRLSGPEVRAFCAALKMYCLGGSQLGEPIKRLGSFIREHRLATDAVARRVHTVRQTFAVVLSALALGGIFLVRFLPVEVVYAADQYAVMTREIGGLLIVASLVAVMRLTAERRWEIDDEDLWGLR